MAREKGIIAPGKAGLERPLSLAFTMAGSELVVSRTRGIGYAKDAEKYLEAAMEGWTVLRLTEKQLEIDFIERIVAWISDLDR